MPGASLVDGAIVSIDPLSDPRWTELVRSAPNSLVFHHPMWLELIRSQARCQIGAWVVPATDGQLAGGLPFALVRGRLAGQRLVSLPYSTRCPVLLAPGLSLDPAAFAGGLEALSAKRQISVELRDGFAAPHGAQITRTFVAHRLDLADGMTAITKRFSRGQRSNIAKALREGVVVERRTDADALRSFYRLHVQTRRRLGLPTPSKSYILRFARLFEAGLGFVMLARQHGRDTAACLFFTTGGTLFYEAGASDARFLHSRPNNLLFREAILWACENGHHTFDFGRTDPDNSGLLGFKDSWGATSAPLVYCRYGAAVGTSSRKARQAVSVAIRHAPPVFGRLVGAAYYRHFA